MIIDIKLPDYDTDCLFEPAEVIKEDGVSGCDLCCFNKDCNTIVEAMCESMIGHGKYWKEVDPDEEVIIRMERQLAHG